MIFTDIQSDDDGDLFIDPNANDFVISPSDQQHISDIIISFVGWWKQFSLVGVGLSSFLNSSGREQELERLISLQLQADGYQTENPRAFYDINGKLIIAPNAIRN